MRKGALLGIVISLSTVSASLAQSNEYPLTGNVIVNSYSPLIVLKRDTDDGGFISGIQTKMLNGANNWYFGNLHTERWIVSKGNYENPLLTVFEDGKVGIGTVNPDAKLAVKGIIHSQEVKIDMNGWSDFVFKKEYSLPTLEEVEKHITEKGHLENIPSEKEVLKDGIYLGEMNAKLLQKIEEMTLYIIEQNKKIIDLEKRLKKVEKKSK